MQFVNDFNDLVTDFVMNSYEFILFVRIPYEVRMDSVMFLMYFVEFVNIVKFVDDFRVGGLTI